MADSKWQMVAIFGIQHVYLGIYLFVLYCLDVWSRVARCRPVR